MTSDELIADLDDRLGRAIAAIDSMETDATNDPDRRKHLASKKEGFAVVKDWLRSYQGLVATPTG